MSEAQFERALSTEQMREALALLDGTANTKLGKLEVGNPAPAEPAADPASTTAAENWVSAEADPRHRKMRFNLVVAFSGLGIAATAALTLLPWSEGELVSSAQPKTSSEQRANLQPTQLQDSGSIPFSANLEFDQGSFASGRRDSKPEFAGPNPVDQSNRAEDQAAAAASRPGGSRERAQSQKSFRGAPRQIESPQLRSDFGDVIGSISRKPMARPVSTPHARYGVSNPYSMNRPVP